MNKKLIIFLIASVVRCVVAYIFYGSIDVAAFIGINVHTVKNTLVLYPPAIWCSFPVIPFYLWFCGLVSMATTLPLAFCFKMIPIFFDTLIALLIYDIVRNVRENYAMKAGMLYALSPISIIITCIHGQWEALPIFFLLLGLYVRTCFRDSYQKYFVYGLLFAFAFFLKPLPSLFGLFFFEPWPRFKEHCGRCYSWLVGSVISVAILVIASFIFFKINRAMSLGALANKVMVCLIVLKLLFVVAVGAFCLWKYLWPSFPQEFKAYLRYQAAAVAGLMTMTIFCCAMLTLYGFNVFHMVDKILRYFNQGIQTCGLPFAGCCQYFPIALILKNRFWVMGVIAWFAVLYYRGKLDVYYAILLALLAIFGTSGISPQYLLWLVPFLLITGFYRVLAIFNLLCTVFFILYYMNPMTNAEVPYQSMLSFAALSKFRWLMPHELLTHSCWLPVIHGLGNYVMPLLFLATMAWILVAVRHTVFGVSCHLLRSFSTITNGYFIASFGMTLSIALLMAIVDATNHATRFQEIVANALQRYDICSINGYLSGNYTPVGFFNIACILFILAIWWSIALWRMSGERSS